MSNAQLLFTKYDAGNPVVPKGNIFEWDDSSVWWPNVIFVNDTFYMTYIGTDDFPNSSLSVGLATSTDGKNYKKYPYPILEANGGEIESFSVATGPFHITDSIWYLYYNGISSNPSDPGAIISRASSASPYGPWTRSNDTLLIVGPSGEWDDAFVIPHSIIEDGENLMMYYFGGDTWPNPIGQIGMATSTDNGATWEKYEGNPILSPGPENFDNVSLFGASVVKSGNKWEMFYSGESSSEMGICYATSKNGLNWTKHGVILSPFGDPLAGTFYEGPSIIKNASGYYLYYDYGLQQAGIGLATAERLPGILEVPKMFSRIQEAINASKNGDTVLVSEATYFENINFRGKAITVASHFLIDQDTSHISETIIDGSQPSHSDTGSVVTFNSGEDTTSILMGFTITGGTGTEWPEDPSGYTTLLRTGGGINIQFSGARICNNYITDNNINNDEDAFGAGISAGYITGSKWVVVENNKIFKNKLFSGSWAKGCGIVAGFNNIKIVNNNIHNNTIEGNSNDKITSAAGIWYSDFEDSAHISLIEGNKICNNKILSLGGFHTSGTGVYISNGSGYTLIKNNQISYNESQSNNIIFGNGIMLNFCDSVDVIGNEISSNTYTSGKECRGGGVCINSCNPILKNNLIAFNIATNGGGIFSGKYDKTFPEIINNTIVNNIAAEKGGGFYYHDSYPEIMNSIFWGNLASTGNQIYQYSGSSNISWSDVEGALVAGEGNMNSDPLFIFEDSLFHLSEASPCINAGNPDPAYNDNDGTRNDIGWCGGPEGIVTSLKNETTNSKMVSNDFILCSNYPNPFNPSTTIKYSIPFEENSELSIVKMIVYDILGRQVATLVNEKQKPGNYEVEWNANDQTSGVYFYRIHAGNFMETKKMVLLR
jgi:predicted GH43/DUF377 family glycosyl hydrolase